MGLQKSILGGNTYWKVLWYHVTNNNNIEVQFVKFMSVVCWWLCDVEEKVNESEKKWVFLLFEWFTGVACMAGVYAY